MAGSSWPDLIAGRTAKASEVEAKFDWLEQGIVPMNSGTTTDLAYDLGTVAARWRGLYTGSINPTSTAGGVAIGTTTADAGALLDLAGTKALLLPRLSSTQRDALTGRDGMVIFNSSTSQIQVYRNSSWVNVGGSVFRTQLYETSTAVANTTQTVLNVASGGGRIEGISWRSSAFGAACGARIYIDGNLVGDFAFPSSGSGIIAIGAAGQAVYTDKYTNSATFMANTTTVTKVSERLGWEFATSCAIYQWNSEVTGTMTARMAISLAV